MSSAASPFSARNEHLIRDLSWDDLHALVSEKRLTWSAWAADGVACIERWSAS